MKRHIHIMIPWILCAVLAATCIVLFTIKVSSPSRLAGSTCHNSSDADKLGVSIEENGVVSYCGNMVRGEYVEYKVPLKASQSLSVKLLSLEDNAVLGVIGPDESSLVADVTNVCGWSPKSDDTYTVRVGSSRGNVSYTVIIKVSDSNNPTHCN